MSKDATKSLEQEVEGGENEKDKEKEGVEHEAPALLQAAESISSRTLASSPAAEAKAFEPTGEMKNQGEDGGDVGQSGGLHIPIANPDEREGDKQMQAVEGGEKVIAADDANAPPLDLGDARARPQGSDDGMSALELQRRSLEIAMGDTGNLDRWTVMQRDGQPGAKFR